MGEECAILETNRSRHGTPRPRCNGQSMPQCDQSIWLSLGVLLLFRDSISKELAPNGERTFQVGGRLSLHSSQGSCSVRLVSCSLTDLALSTRNLDQDVGQACRGTGLGGCSSHGCAECNSFLGRRSDVSRTARRTRGSVPRASTCRRTDCQCKSLHGGTPGRVK